jgi:hypothetical protein
LRVTASLPPRSNTSPIGRNINNLSKPSARTMRPNHPIKRRALSTSLSINLFCARLRKSRAL